MRPDILPDLSNFEAHIPVLIALIGQLSLNFG